MNFSDYIIYCDESGDHGLESIDPQFPMFVLAACIFNKEDYTDKITPLLQKFKFQYFGHDQVVLHSRDIRKSTGQFKMLYKRESRERFLRDLTKFMGQAPFTLIASVINKEHLVHSYAKPHNPYSIALRFCLERANKYLGRMGQAKRHTHVVVEARGAKEDQNLELEFRRICQGGNFGGHALPFELVFSPKSANSTGLQVADLVAHPIARHVLKPDQENRAYEIVEKKFDRKEATGRIEGWGLKKLP